MDSNDSGAFREIMTGLAEIYSTTVTTVGLRMRFEALKAYGIEHISQAATVIIKTRKYTTMPTPADFIEAIEGNPDEIADIQKSLVMDAINKYQPNQKFSDPITQGVIDKIGWGKIGQVNLKEIPFLLKDFKDMYKSYKKVDAGLVLNAPDRIKKLLPTMTKELK